MLSEKRVGCVTGLPEKNSLTLRQLFEHTLIIHVLAMYKENPVIKVTLGRFVLQFYLLKSPVLKGGLGRKCEAFC